MPSAAPPRGLENRHGKRDRTRPQVERVWLGPKQDAVATGLSKAVTRPHPAASQHADRLPCDPTVSTIAPLPVHEQEDPALSRLDPAGECNHPSALHARAPDQRRRYAGTYPDIHDARLDRPETRVAPEACKQQAVVGKQQFRREAPPCVGGRTYERARAPEERDPDGSGGKGSSVGTRG